MTATAIDNTKKLTKAELAEAKLKKHALATAAIKRLRNQYNAAAVLKSELEKEQKLIKTRIDEELAKIDMRDFIDVDGTPIIGYRPTFTDVLDMEKVEKKFGENALADCYTTRVGKSFFSKK